MQNDRLDHDAAHTSARPRRRGRAERRVTGRRAPGRPPGGARRQGRLHGWMSRSAEWVPRPLPVLATLLIACGSGGTSGPPDPGPPTPAALAIDAGDDRTAVVATSTDIRPTVRVTDAAGAPVPNTTVTFTVTAGGGWVTDAAAATGTDGRAATTWYLGPAPDSEQTLTVAAAGFSVTFTANAEPLVPGTTYTGEAGYVEFTPGDLPVIISAPHGGTLRPTSIPTRSAPGATIIRDAETDLLALDMPAAFEARTGGTPHVIVLHLHREKLDANRDIAEGAEGNRSAERAWREYHAFIEAARLHVTATHGRGFYIDLHGHGHAIPRLELGYLLTATQLAGSDASLNSTTIVQRSSLRTLAETGDASHADLLRGADSFGTLFEAQGYPAVPSTSQPHPGDDPYFTGGYSTQRHSSRTGGPIDGVQIEANREGVRDTEENRQAFAAALAAVVESYFDAHYPIPLGVAAIR
jgi:N-formylglutamate amidohydrolase